MKRYPTVAAALVAGLCVAASAAPPDTVLALRPLARFDGASAVAIDPFGVLHVSDARLGTVTRMDTTGRILDVLGGPGSDAARFDGPAGLDATNGLVILVADAGNGRVQRFSRDGRFLELIPVSSDPDAPTADPRYREQFALPGRDSDGRPVDVASTDDGRLYVIETVSATVRTWARERRPGPPIGASVGDPYPVRPVGLATDGRRVYVADSGLPGVVVLDGFGRPTRVMGRGVLGGIVDVAWGGGCVWALLPDGLAAFTAQGVLSTRYLLETDDPVVGIAVGASHAYVLTAGMLYSADAVCGDDP